MTQLNSARSQLAPQQQATLVAPASNVTMLLQQIAGCYSSALASPRWNDFKCIRLSCPDTIRVNNAIWREWHVEFISRRRSALCRFTCSMDERISLQPQAVVLAGQYWRRRFDAVTEEYKDWRCFWRARLRHKTAPSAVDMDGTALLCGLSSPGRRGTDSPVIQPDLALVQSLLAGIETMQHPSRCTRGQDEDEMADSTWKAILDQSVSASPLEGVHCTSALSRRHLLHDSISLPFHWLGAANPSVCSSVVGRKCRAKVVTGFGALEAVLPVPDRHPARKQTTTALLHRAVDHCQQQRREKLKLAAQVTRLEEKAIRLKWDIAASQAQLLAGRACPTNELLTWRRDTFDAWMQQRLADNGKWTLVAGTITALFHSFMADVAVTSGAQLHRTLLLWLQRECPATRWRHELLAASIALATATPAVGTPTSSCSMVRARVHHV